MLGCVLPCLGGSCPDTSAFDAWFAITASCVSNNAMSMVAPSPVLSRAVKRGKDRNAGIHSGEQIGDRYARHASARPRAPHREAR